MSNRSLLMMTLAALLFAARLDAQTDVPANLPALDADVEITYKLPNGQEFTKRGRIYRGKNGQVRQDSGQGSIITDLKGGTVTFLIAEKKEARVVSIPKELRKANRGNRPDAVPFEEATIGGRKVVKARGKGPKGENHEFWTAQDLGIVTFSRVEAEGITTTQTLRNLSVREPHPSVFQVPKDYKVTRESLRDDVVASRGANASKPAHPLGRAVMVKPKSQGPEPRQ